MHTQSRKSLSSLVAGDFDGQFAKVNLRVVLLLPLRVLEVPVVASLFLP